MIYRKLSATGDYVFGGGLANFYQNQPEAVGQAVLTRLNLQYGAWFADITDGTPWYTQVLGKNTTGSRDLVLQDRIQNTVGLLKIDAYASQLDKNTRLFSVQATISTIYGTTDISVPLQS